MLQLFVFDKGSISIYPIEKNDDFQDCLHLFCKEVGVPKILVVDPSGEQTSKAVRRFCIQVGTALRQLEENTQCANCAELYVGLKRINSQRPKKVTLSNDTLGLLCTPLCFNS